MKRCFNWMLGLGLLLTACQTDLLPTEAVVAEGEGNVNFTVSTLDGMKLTRSAEGKNSALGGLTNVDFTQYDLRYQLAVYRIEGGDYVEAITPQVKIVKDGYEPVTYSLRLTANRNYQVVVWADFVREGQTEDLHYDTHDFRNITVPELPDKYLLNDESKDAYYVSKQISVGNNGVSEALTLKRPFAKLRVVTTDWNYEKLEMPDNFKVSYYGCKRFVNLDAVLGTSSSDDLGEAGTTAVYKATINPEKDYAEGYDASEHNRTILVDYLMTDVSAQTPIHLTLEALNGETTISSHNLTTDIPIQRNWLTTIIGNTLTTGAEFSVSIDEGFTNEWIAGEEWWKSSGLTPKEPAYDEATNTYTIYTKEEFMWLPDHIDEMREAHNNFTICLGGDIDMSGVEWKPIFPKSGSGKTYTVDGQEHTLRNFSMSGEYGEIYEYKVGPLTLGRYEAYTGVWGKFDGVMKNLTFENITINGLANDKVHYDTNGEPIDHNKEYAYFAGCIGYTGGNQWSMDSKFENVHAKHVQIKSSTTPSQNLGGLVGWVGSGGGSVGDRSVAFRGCSAEDIHLTGYQAGGLVGQILGDRGAQFDNCWTEDVYIRYNYISSSSGFIGNIGDGGLKISFYAAIEINNCSPAQHVEYINDKTGAPDDYEPQSPYYGHKNNKDVVTITSDESVGE